MKIDASAVIPYDDGMIFESIIYQKLLQYDLVRARVLKDFRNQQYDVEIGEVLCAKHCLTPSDRSRKIRLVGTPGSWGSRTLCKGEDVFLFLTTIHGCFYQDSWRGHLIVRNDRVLSQIESIAEDLHAHTTEGGDGLYSVPLALFEEHLRKCIREIDHIPRSNYRIPLGHEKKLAEGRVVVSGFGAAVVDIVSALEAYGCRRLEAIDAGERCDLSDVACVVCLLDPDDERFPALIGRAQQHGAHVILLLNPGYGWVLHHIPKDSCPARLPWCRFPKLSPGAAVLQEIVRFVGARKGIPVWLRRAARDLSRGRLQWNATSGEPPGDFICEEVRSVLCTSAWPVFPVPIFPGGEPWVNEHIPLRFLGRFRTWLSTGVW